ncbi:MAG: insulinase family protein [Alphaproteobacteria bacterium]|nr:insulinase family protein [Alphaproteobacteria bacterium]
MRLLAILFVLLLQTTTLHASVFEAETFTLSNGLQVVVIENHRAPIVTQMIWYKVGAINDPLGKSGIAHVLEHMMFKGTAAVPNGEFSQIIARNGGSENAFTGNDYTAYHQSIARDRLELVMFLESDRMKNLRFLQKDFDPELEVVKEERLMRIENNPAALLNERKNVFLWGDHPYGRPIIGTKKELSALTLNDAKQFYQTHYAPDNAILVVAGDITAEELKPLAEKYYGKIPPSRTAAEKKQYTLPYPVRSRIEMRHPQVRLHSLQRTYIVPSYLSEKKEQSFAYSVLEEILGSYQLGKMYKHFVSDKKTARITNVSYLGFMLDRGTFTLTLTARENKSLSELEKELDLFLSPQSVTQKDVDKAKKRLVADLEYLNDNPETAANLIGRFYALGMTIEDLKNWPSNIEKVSLADVQNAYKDMLTAPSVTTYLMPENTP